MTPDNRTLPEALSDLPDAVVLAICLLIGAWAVAELLARAI